MKTRRTALLGSSLSPLAFDAPNIGSITPGVASLLKAARAAGGWSATDQDIMLRKSPAHLAMESYWNDADAMVAGHKAMRDAAAANGYIPQFAGEEHDNYQARLQYTKYTNVMGDIIDTLSEKPFEKDVELIDADKQPEQLRDFCENVDGANNSITVFLSNTFYNGIKSAVDWIMVDYSERDPSIKTRADEIAAGVRPYWSHVLGRNVLWAMAKVIAGRETIVYARILEPGKPDHVREFIRDEATGLVHWVLYEKRDAWRYLDANGTERTQFWEVKGGDVTIGIIPIVPFATGRRNGRTFEYDAPMRAAADLQITLFRNESAMEWTKMLAAYPMLTGNGIKPPMGPDGKTVERLKTGPGVVLYSPPDGQGNSGNWAYVQPDASLLTFHGADIKTMKDDLRELGRQPLTAQSGNITVITAGVAAGKTGSAVKSWALGLKDAAEIAMKYTCMWFAFDKSVEPELNVFTQWDDLPGDGKDVEALTAARNRPVPDISGATWREEMRRRGILSSEATEEREEARLLEETPADTGDDTTGDEA